MVVTRPICTVTWTFLLRELVDMAFIEKPGTRVSIDEDRDRVKTSVKQPDGSMQNVPTVFVKPAQ